MQSDLFGFVDAQQIAQQAGVQEVELGTLDHSFVDIAMMRGQQVDRARSPAARRRRAHGPVVCETPQSDPSDERFRTCPLLPAQSSNEPPGRASGSCHDCRGRARRAERSAGELGRVPVRRSELAVQWIRGIHAPGQSIASKSTSHLSRAAQGVRAERNAFNPPSAYGCGGAERTRSSRSVGGKNR